MTGTCEATHWNTDRKQRKNSLAIYGKSTAKSLSICGKNDQIIEKGNCRDVQFPFSMA